MLTRLAYLTTSVLLAACAATVDPAADSPDAGIEMEEEEETKTEDGPRECAANEHRCDDACVPKLANDPAVGCALGCNEPCPAVTGGHATCTAQGSCDFECDAPYVEDNGTCVPATCSQLDYSCGSVVDNLGNTVLCGECDDRAICGTDRTCHSTADMLEPNNSAAAATRLADFNDADNGELRHQPLTFHTSTDEDWFQFHVTDGFDAGDPRIGVAVEWAPYSSISGPQLQSIYELTVWFKCDSAEDGTQLLCDSVNGVEEPPFTDALGKGCRAVQGFDLSTYVRPSCTGTQDGGTVTVRLRRVEHDTGEDYSLYVWVH